LARAKRTREGKAVIAHNRNFHDITVQLDGGTFVGCTFERCTLVISGLIPFHLEGCNFPTCKWEFAGPAANTLGILTQLYAGGAKELIEKTFDNIRKAGGTAPKNTITLN
jgi:hypothetical protein